MIIVIDGYNVLRAAFPGPQTTERQREGFIKQLGTYAKKKGHKIILVFDGGPYQWPDKQKQNGIAIVYSGYEKSADDYMKSYMHEHKEKDVFLVSSDREVRDEASRLNIESIGGFSFYNRLQKELEPSGDQEEAEAEIVKIAKDTDPELDELMEESEVIQKKEDLSELRESPAEKPSKKERKKLKKVKKL